MTAAAHAQDHRLARGATEAPARGQRVERRPRSALRLSLLALLAAIGVAALTGLGVWQLERRVWKLDLIDHVQERIHAVPVDAPGPGAWPAVNAADDAYRHVRVRGHFLNDREILVQAVTDLGGGFWVLTPLRTDAGFTVLINRGFVPPERRDPATRESGRPAGEVTVTGLLRMTEPNGAFLRANAPEADRWYSRDVAAMAAARGLQNVAPYFIDADAGPRPDSLPRGGLTVVTFPNNHLVYALTWFGLALMLAGGACFVARDEWRNRRKTPN